MPTAAAMYPPRRILMYRGSKADKSFPAETELAAIFTPSWAKANARAMKNTPARVAEFGLSFRKALSKSSGFYILDCAGIIMFYPNWFPIYDFRGT